MPSVLNGAWTWNVRNSMQQNEQRGEQGTGPGQGWGGALLPHSYLQEPILRIQLWKALR